MMRMHLSTALCVAILASVVLGGCDSNPTNEPSADQINKAVEAKHKAIDNDPSMNAEQKAEMKKHIGGPAKSMPAEKR